MRKIVWILSGIGALFFGLFSSGCGVEMLQKAKGGESYTINLIVHPIAAIIFVVLLGIFLYPLVQKLTQRNERRF